MNGAIWMLMFGTATPAKLVLLVVLGGIFSVIAGLVGAFANGWRGFWTAFVATWIACLIAPPLVAGIIGALFGRYKKGPPPEYFV